MLLIFEAESGLGTALNVTGNGPSELKLLNKNFKIFHVPTFYGFSGWKEKEGMSKFR